MPEESLFESTEEVSEDILTRLSDLCKQFQDLEIEIDEKDTVLKEKKAELEDVSRNLIPTLLNEVGLSEIRLKTGEKVEIKDKLHASVSNKNYTLAYRNMFNIEGGDENAQKIVDDLFKSQVIVESITDDVLNILLDNDISYERKMSIHAQTLKKYCASRLDQGKRIPVGISVFQYQETKIK